MRLLKIFKSKSQLLLWISSRSFLSTLQAITGAHFEDDVGSWSMTLLQVHNVNACPCVWVSDVWDVIHHWLSLPQVIVTVMRWSNYFFPALIVPVWFPSTKRGWQSKYNLLFSGAFMCKVSAKQVAVPLMRTPSKHKWYRGNRIKSPKRLLSSDLLFTLLLCRLSIKGEAKRHVRVMHSQVREWDVW